MQVLVVLIRHDGIVKAGNVLKVDAFLNHQCDVELFDHMGAEWARLFEGVEINKILTGDNEKEVQIYFGANHILFEFDDTIVVSRLIEGEYFKVDQMLSSDYATKISVNKKEFLDCIERASILIRENDKKPIIFIIEDSNMALKLNSFYGSLYAELLIL